jgi:hypothetical protein
LLLVAQAHLVLEQVVVLADGMVELVVHLQLLQVALHNLLLLKVVRVVVVDLQLVLEELEAVQKIH